MILKRIFGKKVKPTINSIIFDTFNWKLVDNTRFKKTWINSEQTSLIGIHFFDNHPDDIPAKLNEINAIRDHYRNTIVNKLDGGLIKCEVVNLNGYDAIEMLVKQPDEPTGIIYNGSFTIPFQEYNYVIKMQAVEDGITGIREAVIMDKWLKENGAPKTDDNGIMSSWSKDPYDQNFNKGRLMNYSEKEDFDQDFPNHHLTSVRNKMKEIKRSIKFGDELNKIEKF